MRWSSVALAAVLLAGCQLQTAPRRSPPPSPIPTPAVSLRAPAAAILSDSEAAAARVGGGDAVSAGEWAASAPDQVVALQNADGWGWSAAARRTWAGPGGRRIDDLVLRTDREEGARRAFAYFAGEAARVPLAAGPCPVAVSGLDECEEGVSGGRSVIVGRLGTELFVLDVINADAAGLAARQAAKLRE